jgi:hypothetical protein
MHGGTALEDVTVRRPYNAVNDFVDAHVARGRADKVAFVDPDRSLTYGDLQARSVRSSARTVSRSFCMTRSIIR